jgi:hypothetical protein
MAKKSIEDIVVGQTVPEDPAEPLPVTLAEIAEELGNSLAAVIEITSTVEVDIGRLLGVNFVERCDEAVPAEAGEIRRLAVLARDLRNRVRDLGQTVSAFSKL